MVKEKKIKDTKIIEKLKESEEHARIFASYQHAISALREFYVTETSFEKMLQKTVDLLVKSFGYYMAWYGEFKVDEKVIIPKVWAGKYEKYLDGLRLELDDSKDAKCAMSLAIVRKEPFGYADLEHDKDFEKWRPLALKYGYRSNQAIPLITDGKCIGAFLIYSTRPRAFSEILIRYLSGIVNELATIIEKITERRKAEEALRESEVRYRTLFESAAEGILVADIETKRFRYANPAICRMLDYNEEELKRKGVDDIHPKDALEHVISEFEAQARGEKTLAPNIPCLRKDGTIIYADINTTKALIDGRECNIGFFSDITERKNAEEELKKYREHLEEMIEERTAELKRINEQLQREITERKKAEEALKKAYKELRESQLQLIQAEKLAVVGQLAAGVAHEINNPLSVISGEAEMLLKDKDKDKDTKDASKNIIEQAERVKIITERLLEFSQKKEFKLEPLDINNAVEKSIFLLGYQVKKEVIEIIKELEPNLPKVLGDNEQVQEVFLNILLNATQAMEEGGRLTIRTRVEEITKYGRRKTDILKLGQRAVVIEFEDTGKGMDEGTLMKVFTPFFTTKEKHTGLGLYICRGIIENHKGIIETQSKLGEGSTFTIKLPVSKEEGGQ